MKIRLLLLCAAAAACQSAPERLPEYAGFDGYARTISTDSALAQRYFDQGIQLLYGFNHDEAIRSFQAATEADPSCAMAWWGIAYANGRDINDPDVPEEDARAAFEAAEEAQRHLADVTPAEAALVRAIGARYAWPSPEDRTPLDQAYADAMEVAYREHPGDTDIGTLFADALMNLQAWNYWTVDGEPRERALEIVTALEHVLALDPQHPGANHLYIHAVEASKDPDRAVAAADRLRSLVPGAGHLVHMPSHIYARVGRYSDAADANAEAIAADKAYFAVAPPPDFYSLYFVHNVHFLAYASMMEGRREAAMAAADELERSVPREFLEGYAFLADGLMTTPLHVMIRFGEWERILEQPEPEAFRKLSIAMRHYARSVAFSALGRTEEARTELASFDAAASEVPEEWTVGFNTSGEVLALARQMILGELLYREGKHDEAFAALREGCALEDALLYDEPPGWMQPIRHALGALLLGAGRAAEAEAVYREDLVRNRDNGWSLLGLALALEAQGKPAESAPVRQALAKAFHRADVAVSSSCFCEPGGDPWTTSFAR